jgi:hypothetical protein
VVGRTRARDLTLAGHRAPPAPERDRATSEVEDER